MKEIVRLSPYGYLTYKDLTVAQFRPDLVEGKTLVLDGFMKNEIINFCTTYPNLYPIIIPDTKYEKNLDKAETDGVIKFTELDGDAYGRMAHIIAQGMPVVNQIMKPNQDCAFYGRVLQNKPGKGAIHLIGPKQAETFYPFEKINIRLLAKSEWLPMLDYRNCQSPALIVSDNIPGLSLFWAFWHKFNTNEMQLFSNDIDGYSGRELPVFRWEYGFKEKV